MKKLMIITVLSLLTAVFAYAQKIITKKLEVNGKKTEMKLSFADTIHIEAWDNNYVEVVASVNINDNEYNDYYTLNTDFSNSTAGIEEKVDFEGIKKVRGEKKMNNFNTEIIYKVWVPKELEFKLETISGQIELIGCQGEMSINTISGFIDYSIPEKHKANIGLSTISGDVYSNIKFDNKLPEKISWVGTNQELSLNGGDTEVQLKTISGNIYLRRY